MNVLIVGRSGQLARELIHTAPQGISVAAFGRSEIDLNSEESIREAISASDASTVINASAYTAVDKAETDREAAYAINSEGVKLLAQVCAKLHVRLLHVSTDFVFGDSSAVDGGKILPLKSSSTVAPLGVYGESKLAGEQHVLHLLPGNSVIVRTAWVYSSFGNNFVKTMVNLMRSKQELGVIVDQIGTPTWARGLANWLWVVAQKQDVNGIFHWSDAGVASWYDFSIAIRDLGLQYGLITDKIPIRPISTVEYPTPAKRPSYSVLDKGGAYEVGECEPIHWREQLGTMIAELAASGY